MLEDRLRKRQKHLGKWARRTGVTCYRVYDRDIPEIPLAVDRYGEHALIARYAREQGPSIEPEWQRQMAAAVARALDVPEAHVHVKERARQRGSAQYQRLARFDTFLTMSEGGHRFAVNLDDYLDTGLFLDHRPTRARVAAEAHGKRFLNLFCYTASFTVYAAGAGARASLSVDLSRRYLAWAEHNFALNQIDSRAHRLLCADVLAWLREPVRERFDLAVLDPPTFSNSKKMQGVLDIQHDHAELIGLTLARLHPGGVLYFSTNFRGFKLDRPAISAGEIADISEQTIPEDFRDRRIHRCYRLVK